ncbi:MAG: class I adenylate-forming enzyme family protein [Vampirovibrionia bacterium]
MSLYLELKSRANKSPDSIAIISNNEEHTYKKLLLDINKVSSSLKHYHIDKNDHIGILCANQIEHIHLLFGLNKIGAVAVPINIMQPEIIIMHIIENSRIKLLFAEANLIKMAGDLIEKLADYDIKTIVINSDNVDNDNLISYKDFLNKPYEETDIIENKDQNAVLLYTSGTTGLPKGVLLSNRNLLSNVKYFGLTMQIPEKYKAILSLPMFHSFGQIVLLVCLFGNITTILISQFLPSTILKLISSYQAEILPLVPTMFNLILEAAKKKNVSLSSVKYCITGGAAIPISLYDKLLKETNACIIEGYGLTETSPVITISNSKNCYKKDSVGKVLDCLYMKIAEDGEILVRGDSVVTEYWNDEISSQEGFSEDGYFKTGDIGYIDNDGFVFITDRKKDLIIRAGENISPKQIEDMLLHLDGIKDVAVFGVKDEKLGEAIYCAVECEDHIDANYIKSICKSNLQKHLIPEDVIIMPTLPRNSLGKILKYKLQESFALPVV